MLVDFTGYTCTNCRWMEANMFVLPEVKAEMEATTTAFVTAMNADGPQATLREIGPSPPVSCLTSASPS